VIVTMLVCDEVAAPVCRCLGEDSDDPYSCSCSAADGPHLVCADCGAPMVAIDVDSGRRLAS
jgi:hypothetical protein